MAENRDPESIPAAQAGFKMAVGGGSGGWVGPYPRGDRAGDLGRLAGGGIQS